MLVLGEVRVSLNQRLGVLARGDDHLGVTDEVGVVVAVGSALAHPRHLLARVAGDPPSPAQSRRCCSPAHRSR